MGIAHWVAPSTGSLTRLESLTSLTCNQVLQLREYRSRAATRLRQHRPEDSQGFTRREDFFFHDLDASSVNVCAPVLAATLQNTGTSKGLRHVGADCPRSSDDHRLRAISLRQDPTRTS
jgi:hypothetical protein